MQIDSSDPQEQTQTIITVMQPGEIFEALQPRLFELSEARAPFALPHGGGDGEQHRLQSLFRGPGSSGLVVELLRCKWILMQEHGQSLSLSSTTEKTRDRWLAQLRELHADVYDPCDGCGAGSGGMMLGAWDCARCRRRFAAVAVRLEALGMALSGSLEDEARALSDALGAAREELGVANGSLEEKERQRAELEGDLGKTKEEHAAAEEKLREVEEKNARMEKFVGEMMEDVGAWADSLAEKKEWKVAAGAYGALAKWTAQQGEDSGDEEVKKKKAIEAFYMKTNKLLSLIGLYEDNSSKEISTQAEVLAKELLDEIRAMPGADQDKVRETQRLYCEVLRDNAHFDDAEREYMTVWYSPGLSDSDTWKIENGEEMAGLMMERKRIDEAAIWHRRVAEMWLRRKALDRAARNTVAMMKCHADDGAFQINDRGLPMQVWNARDAARHDEDVVACGEELVRRLQKQGNLKEAEPIAREVWNGWKALKDPRALESAFRLVEISEANPPPDPPLDKFRQLEVVYSWICSSTEDAEKKAEYFYRLGCIQTQLQKLDAAEESLARALENPGSLKLADHARYQKTYAEILQERDKHDQAVASLQLTWERFDQLLGAHDGQHALTIDQLVPMLQTGHLYGDALLELGRTADAVQVLGRTWTVIETRDVLSQVRRADMPQYTLRDLVGMGDCYAHGLLVGRALPRAIEVIKRVMALKKENMLGDMDLNRSDLLRREIVEAMAPPTGHPGGGKGPVSSLAGGGGKGGLRERSKSPAAAALPRLHVRMRGGAGVPIDETDWRWNVVKWTAGQREKPW